jgi:hypothetical protein
MLDILNKRITTKTGIIVLVLVASFTGWLMVKEYVEFMEIRYAPLEIMINE